jgi:GTP-binding protein
VSASHGRGVSQFLDAVVARLPEMRQPRPPAPPRAPRRDDDDRPIRIAFVGKPNVGKSSLVNCLLGEERVLVHDQPGTTRDPIDTAFSFGGREYILVDTAGMRRRRSIDTRAEHVSAAMARSQIERCDVAVLVVDAREAATAEDARMAGEIEESGRGALVVLNKKDLVGRREIDARIETTARGAGVSRLRARDRDVGGHARRGHRHHQRGDRASSARRRSACPPGR